jgi:hypothetical protein
MASKVITVVLGKYVLVVAETCDPTGDWNGVVTGGGCEYEGIYLDPPVSGSVKGCPTRGTGGVFEAISLTLGGMYRVPPSAQSFHEYCLFLSNQPYIIHLTCEWI